LVETNGVRPLDSRHKREDVTISQLKQLIAVMNCVQLGSVPRELSRGRMVSILSLSCTSYVQWHQTKGVYLVESADGGLVSALRALRTERRLTILLVP
jgi:hypothetical protein